jgi:pimeloyl-ACP methyl ester carboxylesterase
MAVAKLRTWPGIERGTGRSVVFLHGYPLNHAMWGPQLDAVSQDHRVILLDMPGYGLAAEEPVPNTLRDFSEKVFLTLEAKTLIDVVLVGHSFGGYVALQLCRDHPELLGGLVLTNTRSKPDTPEAREKRLATIHRLERAGETLDVEATARSLVAPETWNAGGPLVERVRSLVREAKPTAIRGALNAMATRPDLTPVLATIDVPTLVVWGEQDQLIPPAETQSLLGPLRRKVGVGIPGAGHLPSLETPDLFNRTIDDFLGRIPRP